MENLAIQLFLIRRRIGRAGFAAVGFQRLTEGRENVFLVFGTVESYFSQPVEKFGLASGQNQGNAALFQSLLRSRKTYRPVTSMWLMGIASMTNHWSSGPAASVTANARCLK